MQYSNIEIIIKFTGSRKYYLQ